MKKSLLIAGFTAGLYAACGGVTTGDIEDAARELDVEDSASRLRLGLGQTWDSTISVKTTDKVGSVSTAGAFNEITASQSVDEETYVRRNKVTRTTYVEAVDKNGFVVESVQRKTGGKSTTGSVTVDQTLSNIDERGSEVMFEVDGWARELSEGAVGDADLNPGSASYPLAPVVNGVYVADNGSIYKGEAGEAVGAFNTVAISRQQTPDLYKIEDFYKDCFEVTPGALAASSDVNVKASCIGNQIKGGTATFVKSRSTKHFIGRQLVLKSVTTSDIIRLDVLVCTEGTNVTENTFNTGLTSCTGSISLGRNGGPVEQITESTTEVTAIGRDSDVTALPEIPEAAPAE